MLSLAAYKVPTAVGGSRRFTLRETTPVAVPRPRVLDRVRRAFQARHSSSATAEAHGADYGYG